jgi:hypothetical protein
MKTYDFARTVAPTVVGAWLVPFLLLGAAMAAQGQPTTEAGVQILTRGPMHEAFAEASMSGATAGVVVRKSPYDPITELPPDQRPEGANVAWIPGYWSWDDDRNDFIWVSGVWRDLPPGRQWVPGYWAPVQGGSQWISGFWGVVAQTEVTYLPPPPAPLEAGPSSPMPSPGNLWSPGCWVWQQTRYDWQPGYWVMQQPDWVWTPAYYTWTPRGHVYVPGYWDHDIVHRGVMFAPVYYAQPVYRQPSYYYSPSTVIDLAVILTSLFVQPRSRHYYYGDYYDRRYEERGFHPWYSSQAMRYGDDPIYSHYRSRQLLQNRDWDRYIDDQYRYRRQHVDARPPQTLALQINIINNQRSAVPENFLIGRSFAEVARSTTQPLRFTSVNMDERRQIQTRGREVHKLQGERARLETAPRGDGASRKGRETTEPFRMELPASPVAARPAENVQGARTPPPTPAAPSPQAAEGRGREGRPQLAPQPQATEGGRRQVKPQKVEVQTETPRTRREPERAKPAVEAQPERPEARPSPTREKPQQVAPETVKREPAPQRVAPERVKREPAPQPQRLAPKTEPTRRRTVPVETESRSRAPQAVETARPQKVEARPEARPTKSRQVHSGPKAAEPKRELRKPETPKPEVRSRTPEPKAQAQRDEARKQKGNREQAPRTQDNKSKKRGK